MAALYYPAPFMRAARIKVDDWPTLCEDRRWCKRRAYKAWRGELHRLSEE